MFALNLFRVFFSLTLCFPLIFSQIGISPAGYAPPFDYDGRPCYFPSCWAGPKNSIKLIAPFEAALNYMPLGGSPALPRGFGNYTANVIFPSTADGILACSPFVSKASDNGIPYEGNILVIKTGQCAKSIKQSNYESTKAVAVLFWETVFQSAWPYNAASTTFGEETKLLNVSTLVITNEDGVLLQSLWSRSLAEGFNITAVIQRSGYMIPSNVQFFVDAKTSLSLTIPTTVKNQQLLSSWNTAYTPNSAEDPCVNRIYHVWCENGEVTWIFWTFASPTGVIPDSFGNLKSLAFWHTSDGSLGTVPATICGQMPHVWLFHMQNTYLTSIPDCFDTLTNLHHLWLYDNKLTTFPSSVMNANKLIAFRIDGNLIAGPIVPNRFVSQSIQQLGLSNNQFTGPVPGFPRIMTGFHTLNYTLFSIDCSNNQFTSILDGPSHFDNFPSMQTLILSNNQIFSPLPTLSKSLALTQVSLDNNRFYGSPPAQWTALSSVTSLNLAHNLLNGSTIVFKTMPALQSLDLSWNRLGDFLSTPDKCSIIHNAAGSKVTTLDISHNGINGPCSPVFMSNLPVVSKLIVSYNNLFQIPTDIFISNTLTYFDWSHNNVNSQVWPNFGSPKPQLVYFDISNNPDFKGVLPNWLALSTSSIIKKSGTNYFCGTLYNALNPSSTFLVDQSLYGYKGCTCDAGYYNEVPNCRLIPSRIASSANDVLSALETGGNRTRFTFSDGWFGQARQIPGIDISFDVNATNSLVAETAEQDMISFSIYPIGSTVTIPSGAVLDKVRAIIFFIHMDLAYFKSFSDSLTLSDSKGNRLFNTDGATANAKYIHQLQSQWPEFVLTAAYSSRFGANYAEFIRPAVMSFRAMTDFVTIDYKSRNTNFSGVFLSYAFSSLAPSGYHINAATNLLEADVPEYVVSSGIRYAIYALSAFVGVLIILVMLYILKHINTSLVRASSKYFSLFFLFMLLVLAGGASLYAIVPSSSSRICDARIWLSSIGLVGAMGVLIAKSFRVSLIFGSKVLLAIRAVTDAQVALMVLSMTLVEVLMLSVMTGLEMTWAELKLNNGEVTWQCSIGNGFDAWMGVQIAYFFVLMISGAIVAYKTRRVPSAFNESTYILSSLQTLLFFMVILVPLDWALVNNSPNASIVIQGGGQLFLACSLLFINYLPKIYYLYIGCGNDKNLMYQSTGVSIALSGASKDTSITNISRSSSADGASATSGKESLTESTGSTRI